MNPTDTQDEIWSDLWQIDERCRKPDEGADADVGRQHIAHVHTHMSPNAVPSVLTRTDVDSDRGEWWSAFLDCSNVGDGTLTKIE